MDIKKIRKMNREIKKLKKLGPWGDTTPQYKIIQLWNDDILPYLIEKEDLPHNLTGDSWYGFKD